MLHRVPQAGLASGDRDGHSPGLPELEEQGPWHESWQDSPDVRRPGAGWGWVDQREAPFSQGSQTQPGATGARARTYWSPLLLSPPQDGRPLELGEGCSFPQELIVEEQDPLLLSLEPGRGVNASGSAGAGGGGWGKASSKQGSGGELGASWCVRACVRRAGAGPEGRTLGK